MDSTNGKKILKAISDLEDEISSFGDTVANMVGSEDDRVIHKNYCVKNNQTNDCTLNPYESNQVNDDFASLTTNLQALRGELISLKSQLDQQSCNSAPMQNDLSQQVSQLAADLEEKFKEINLADATQPVNVQKPRFIPHQSEKSNPTVVKEPSQSADYTDPYALGNEGDEEKESKSCVIEDHYTNFLNGLRDECIERIKKAITAESKKIVGQDDLSIRQLFEAIFDVVEQERIRFQNTLRDINERIFLALDDRMQVEPSQPEQLPSNPKASHKQLIKQMSEIQERLNNNLIKQYRFYGIKKN